MHLTGGSTLMDFISVLGGFYDAEHRAVYGINSCAAFPKKFKGILASDSPVAAATVSRDEFLGVYGDYHAPRAVVRGDGALISAEFARRRPIETILSGPAASIVGARWMTGAQDALVSDIGGTTTDIAVLRDGRPAIDPEGARGRSAAGRRPEGA